MDETALWKMQPCRQRLVCSVDAVLGHCGAVNDLSRRWSFLLPMNNPVVGGTAKPFCPPPHPSIYWLLWGHWVSLEKTPESFPQSDFKMFFFIPVWIAAEADWRPSESPRAPQVKFVTLQCCKSGKHFRILNTARSIKEVMLQFDSESETLSSSGCWCLRRGSKHLKIWWL